MALRISLRRLGLAAVFAALGLEAGVGCSADKEPPKGQLIIAFQTDMTVPDDVDEIRVQILLQGVVRHDVTYAVGPAPERNPLPATLAVVAGSDPAIPVTVRLIGLQGGKPHVLRKAITTVPSDRIALLQMPIQWLCWGDVQETELDTFSDACGDQTCVAGSCVDANIDSHTLPSYSAANVFGGAPGPGKAGKCVDVLGCFDQGFETPVSQNPCRIALPPAASLDSLNVGLVLPPGSQGICGPSACIVLLESDPFLGWQASGIEIGLPQSVCDRIGIDITAVAVTTACVTKTPGIPICAPWSSVFGDFSEDASAPDKADAGADASLDTSSESDSLTIPQSNLLGIECATDAACGGITCLTPTGLAGGSAGPIGGICTYPCTPNQDICDQVKPGAACLELSFGEYYCVEGCTPGQTTPAPCSGRPNIVCAGMLDVGTQSQTHACLPQCNSDSACGDVVTGSFCHQLDGLCKATSPGAPTVGFDCGGEAGGVCNDSTCTPYPDPEGGIYASGCTSVCPLGDLDVCGTMLSGSACIWPQDPAHLGLDEAGQCMSLCGCAAKQVGCDTNFVCVTFPSFMDPTAKAALIADGWEGYCGPPFGPNGQAVSWSPGGC